MPAGRPQSRSISPSLRSHSAERGFARVGGGFSKVKFFVAVSPKFDSDMAELVSYAD